MTLDEAIRHVNRLLATDWKGVDRDAVSALLDHAQAGQMLRDVYAMPAVTGPTTLRDRFAMHAPWQGVEQFYVYATGPNERVRLVAARWAYADAMMAARGTK